MCNHFKKILLGNKLNLHKSGFFSLKLNPNSQVQTQTKLSRNQL